MSLYSAARARSALIHTVAFRVLSQAGTILSFIVLVRGISEHDLGIYSLLYSVIPVIGTLASLGLDQILKRYQPEYLHEGKIGASAWLLRVVVRLRFLVTLAAITAIVLCWQLIAPLFHLEAHLHDFELFSIVVMLYFQTVILQNSLASHMLQKFSVGSAAAFSISKLMGYLVVARYFDFTLQAIILADTFAYVVSYMVLSGAYLHYCRISPEERGYRPDKTERRRLIRYGTASHFNEASSLMLYTQTDNFFIAALMNPLAVGTYSFFTRINEMATQLIPLRLFENIVQPIVYAIPKDQAPEKLPRYFTFLLNISMISQWPIIMMSMVYHREIIDILFAGKFIEYAPLMPIVLAFAWSENVPSLPVTMLALHAENASLILKSQLFGLYQIVAMLVLIPLLGLYGAAIATGTLHLFRTLWVWWMIRDTARWLNVGPALRQGFAIWGTAALACAAVKHFVPMPATANIAFGVLACGASVLLFLRSGAIAQSDREILANLMRGKESAVLRWLGLAPVVAQR